MLYFLVGLLLVIGVTGCNENAPTTPTAAPTGAARPDPSLGLLVRADGQVEISRQHWASGQWSPVSVGTLVAADDLLDVPSSSAMLLCPDWSLQEITAGPDNSPCPRDTAIEPFTYDGYQLRGSVRGIDDEVPYILYPRQALILEERPLLRWHDTGAASYTVTLEADSKHIWHVADVTGTELRYPDTAPALEKEKVYQLVVQDTDTGRSSLEDASRGTGFRLASDEDHAAIAAQQARITALDELDEAEQQLAVAVYLLSQSPDDPPEFGYWGEGWLRLEAAAQVHNTPSVWRWQGEALLAMRLPNEAEQAYNRALDQAEMQGNRDEQARALAGLWYVTKEQPYFNAALRLYEDLGAEEQVEALRESQ
jgi:hypothetical protein